MEKVKVGIIGCGYMAQMAHIPCIKANANAELTALCDWRRPEVAKKLSSMWDVPDAVDSVDKLLNMDIDAVFVLTPLKWHLANISDALEAGKFVFAEKPAAMSVESVNKLAAMGGKGVTVGYMKPHENNVVKLLEMQKKADWGRMLFIRTHSFIGGHWNGAVDALAKAVVSPVTTSKETFSPDPAPAWLKGERNAQFYSFENPFYALLDTGCHSVNFLRHLAGKDGKITNVRNLNGVRLIDFDFDGIPGVMEFCLNFNMRRFDEVTELYFERATVKITTPPPLDRQSAAIVEIYSEKDGTHQRLILDDNHSWAFALQTDDFIRKVQSGDTASDLAEAAKDVEIIENIYKFETGVK